MRIYAIGDVHGRADLLRLMHSRIEQDLATRPPSDFRVIHIGDYCDRGPDTCDVFDILVERMTDPRYVALAGNHDVALPEFLSTPRPYSMIVEKGGEATLRSYGVTPKFDTQDDLEDTSRALARAMPTAHLHLLEGLERQIVFGDFFFCHAGIRPGVPLDHQDGEDLIWIRQEFLSSNELFDRVIVHGHTPRRSAEILPNRINVDTGAWETGILTAIVLEEDQARPMHVRLERAKAKDQR